jgi:hypothetical protein
MEVVEISPLEGAVHEVEEKTKELALLHLKYQALAKTTQDVSTNALAMCLNTAVDAPQNSGISSYRQIFFKPDYVVQFPERVELVEKLRIAIDEQVLKISTFEKYALTSPRLRPLMSVSNCMGCYALPSLSLSTKHWLNSSKEISTTKFDGWPWMDNPIMPSQHDNQLQHHRANMYHLLTSNPSSAAFLLPLPLALHSHRSMLGVPSLRHPHCRHPPQTHQTDTALLVLYPSRHLSNAILHSLQNMA